MFIGPPDHSTSWKLSTCWKFGLYFVYIFIADWNLLTKFCSSDPSFNGNIFTFLYLKSKTSARAQLCDYSFIHTIYKFHGTVLAGNSHWGYLLISGVYRHVMNAVMWHFLKHFLLSNFLIEMSTFTSAMKLSFGRNRFGKRTMYNLQTKIHF